MDSIHPKISSPSEKPVGASLMSTMMPSPFKNAMARNLANLKPRETKAPTTPTAWKRFKGIGKSIWHGVQIVCLGGIFGLTGLLVGYVKGKMSYRFSQEYQRKLADVLHHVVDIDSAKKDIQSTKTKVKSIEQDLSIISTKTIGMGLAVSTLDFLKKSKMETLATSKQELQNLESNLKRLQEECLELEKSLDVIQKAYPKKKAKEFGAIGLLWIDTLGSWIAQKCKRNRAPTPQPKQYKL